MKHTVTITIPSYKEPELLERALLALCEQTYTDFGVLIIDDASETDFTPILERFGKQLDITIMVNEHNLGAMDNIYKSITLHTDSKYIFSHHQDDFIKNNYLELAVTILEKNKDVSFVLSSAEWIPKNSPYISKLISNNHYTLYTPSSFVYAITKNVPFMFGSVVYRVSDIIHEWKYSIYNTLCDRVYLVETLLNNKSKAAYIEEAGLFVRDHSLEEHDTRSQYQNEDHTIALYSFYKNNLEGAYQAKEIAKQITNAVLLAYNSYENRGGLIRFYKKAKKQDLISLSSINLFGLYALLTLPLNPTKKQKMIKLIKQYL